MFSSSPMLIAAYRVFHRLSAPRHSPVALDILFLKNFTIPFPFPYSIVNEQHPPVFPTGTTRPCLDDCREIFASMTNHGPYVSKLVVEVGGIEPSTAENVPDDLWIGVKGQSNPVIAGSPRNILRYSLGN